MLAARRFAPAAARAASRCALRGLATHFASSHEYAKVDGGVATVGITDYAANALGDIVFVDLPEAPRRRPDARARHARKGAPSSEVRGAPPPFRAVLGACRGARARRLVEGPGECPLPGWGARGPQVGDDVEKGESFGAVESVKAASDVYAPVSGEVVEINEALADTPDMVNSSALEDGWFIKVKISDEGELSGLMDDAAYAEHTKE
mmetsp:Transcript_17744/g.52782  ORF Transcript_17744/g.52782 Transcript_17744/m.52782 type:complete len:207 (+) Transcript_17744:69-689(+)